MTKHVFLSFVVEDETLVNLFRGQATNKNSGLTFDDYSIKESINSTNAPYIKSRITERIRACSVLICLTGEDTAKSSWVTWEIQKAAELGKKILGVRLHSNTTKDKMPSALTTAGGPVYDWDIPAIVSAIRV